MKKVVFFSKLNHVIGVTLKMATLNGDIDQYGFERPEDFDFQSYEAFMSDYLVVLARRMAKWDKFTKNSTVSKSRTVKRYVRKGIPSELRAEIWLNISGAEKLVSQSSLNYGDYLSRSNAENKVVESIERDIRRTYPENIYFKDVSESLLTSLSNVLKAYANFNEHIGYCQGLNYIVGMLLLVTKDESQAFWLLVQMLGELVPDFYSERMLGLRIECQVLDLLLLTEHPALHHHFHEHNIDMELFTSKWFVCLFMDILPVETVLRIWDCLFYEGSKVLLRVAYTLIVSNKEKFLELKDFTKLCNLFKDITKDEATLQCHQFMKKCFTVPKSFSLSKIKKFREQVHEKLLSEKR